MAGAFNRLQVFKMGYSTILLVFSVTIIMVLIFDENTKVSRDVHPVAAFVLIWCAVIWLSMVEAGQGALVGLPPVNTDLYKESHPTTHLITKLAHKGDNLDRYLMGRQFMVIFIVFTTNMCGGPLPDSDVLGLPSWLQSIFLNSGAAMILMTTCIGQLTSQVNASHCMLDFIDNYFALFTLYVAMGIEATGLLHSCYLVQIFFAKVSGKPLESQEPTRSSCQSFFFWGRIFISLVALCYSLAVTLKALFDGKTTMWEGVPRVVTVLLFFMFMSIIGMLEGMQVAFFAVTKLHSSEQGRHPYAMQTCELLFRGDGRNLPGFMIGRQICVTMCFFFAARVTSPNVDTSLDGGNVFDVSDNVQEFFNTGLLGALVTTILGSISWQLVASSYPAAFLSNPLVYLLLRICLLLESTGICSAAWFLAMIQKKIVGYQLDEVYIGTPEDRAKMDKRDRNENLHVEDGLWRVPAYPPGCNFLSPCNSMDGHDPAMRT